MGQKHGSLLHARGSHCGGMHGYEPSTFCHACEEAMEIDASPDFCHLDVTSFETALPLCRAVVASDCTQISEFNSQCDPALLNSFPLQTPTLSSQEGRFKQCTTGTTCLRKPCQHDSTCRRRHSLWNELSSLSLSFRFPIVDSVDPPAAITAEDCR